jgi:inorganic triphosphatase YgiF
VFPIQSANSSIEVAIDRAHIVGEDALSFCELELELKRGAASEMARIARRIASEVPAALSLKTKAERGFALREAAPTAARFSEPVHLTGSTRVGEAFQHIAWTCLRHFALNKDAAETGDTRAVHQMLVALQRLTGVIATFRKLLDGPETDAVKAELAWLGGELIPACELDRFLATTLAPLREHNPDDAALEALAEEALARRGAALDRVRQAIAADRYRELVLRTALWIIAAEWSDAGTRVYEHPSRRVGALAARSLTAQTTKLAKAAGAFTTASDSHHAELHEAVLRLQSTAYFFDGVFAKTRKRRRSFDNLLDTLATDFGRLVEMATTDRLRDTFMGAWTEPTLASNAAQKALAMGYVLGLQAPERAARKRAIVKGLERLDTYRGLWIKA